MLDMSGVHFRSISILSIARCFLSFTFAFWSSDCPEGSWRMCTATMPSALLTVLTAPWHGSHESKTDKNFDLWELWRSCGFCALKSGFAEDLWSLPWGRRRFWREVRRWLDGQGLFDSRLFQTFSNVMSILWCPSSATFSTRFPHVFLADPCDDWWSPWSRDGSLVQELSAFAKVLETPAKPVLAILGGAKVRATSRCWQFQQKYLAKYLYILIYVNICVLLM